MSTEDTVRVDLEALRRFCVAVFTHVGVSESDARVIADVLTTADLRGVDSHGVARVRFYLDHLAAGHIVLRPEERVLAETPSTAVVDAGAGFGPPAAHRAMQRAIDKALAVGSGTVVVRNSNHFGIAGYYAMMALEHGCIGMAMTNASPLLVPTFAAQPLLGTNPIAVAAPAGDEPPFVLDMASTTVPLGKLEIYDRLGKPIPLGWATDEQGLATSDGARVISNWKTHTGGGLTPLGGEGETFSGHKGYGLSLMVDILAAVLSGAAYSTLVYPKTPDGKQLPGNLGHFFAAWRVDAFRPLDEFQAAMDDLQRRLKSAPRVPGAERIYVHGEKEHEAARRRAVDGVPLNGKVAHTLRAVAVELGLDEFLPALGA